MSSQPGALAWRPVSPRAWRSGFQVGSLVAAAAPFVALGLVATAQATTESGDIRAGVFPWLLALAAVLFAFCCMGLLAAHSPHPGRWMLLGSWWTALAFLGIASGFLAIGVGSVLGFDEESAGAFASLPLIGLAFGIISMTPALVVTAIGAAKKEVLPRWGKGALWLEAPLLPLLLVYGGIVDDNAETVGSTVGLGIMAFAWVVIGLSIRAAESATSVAPLSSREGPQQ